MCLLARQGIKWQLNTPVWTEDRDLRRTGALTTKVKAASQVGHPGNNEATIYIPHHLRTLKCFPQYYGAFKTLTAKRLREKKERRMLRGWGLSRVSTMEKLKKQAQKERCVMFLFICKSLIRIIKKNKKVVLGTVISQCGDILSG